jgi:hypothetical protein
MYDYEAAEEGELSFVEGQTISSIEFIDDGWWRGEVGGLTGVFPSNYVTML